MVLVTLQNYYKMKLIVVFVNAFYKLKGIKSGVNRLKLHGIFRRCTIF